MARRVFLLVLLVAWLAANLLFGGELFGAEWHFHAMGNLGGNDGFGKTSQALGVSGDGLCVVGDSLATAGMGITSGTEALLWVKPNLKTRIGAPVTKNVYASAKAVSLQGRVVVGECQTKDGKRAFRWSKASGFQILDLPPGHDESTAWGVSGNGAIIVGECSSLAQEWAFRWTNGKMVPLDDLPGGKKKSVALAISLDGTTIVGYSHSQNGSEAVAWTTNGAQGNGAQGNGARGLGSLGGKRFASRAFAVSANGAVIVGDSLSPQGAEAFRWTQQTGMVPLGDLPGGISHSRASGVSADGNAIVGTANSENGPEAFIWTPETKIQSLGQLLAQQGLAKGWRLQEAYGISSDGKVIGGVGLNPQRETAGWIAELR